MESRALGGTGVQVSHLFLGAMMFGAWGNTDHAEGVRVIRSALDRGVNFVDTADVYSSGDSEQIVGKALKGRRDRVVLATKFHGSMGDDRNMRGNSRRWIQQACQARAIEADVLPRCQGHRTGVIAWSPLKGGWLTGKYRRGQEPPAGSGAARNWAGSFDTPESQRKLDLVEERSKVAVEQRAVTSAIIGPRTMDVRLDAAVLDRIDELVAPGTNVNPGDAGWTSPHLDARSRRRS